MRASESQNRLFRTSRERNAGSPARRGGRRLWRLAVAVVLLSAFAAGTALAQSITVLTHGSFALPTELVEDFTATTGIEVEFLMGGDAGEVVNRAILTKGRPLADLLFGVDENLLERARAEGIFEPYLSPELERVPEEYWLDAQGLVTPVDVGYVVPNYDVAWFQERGLGHLVGLGDGGAAGGAVADQGADRLTLADLAGEPYAGLLAVLDPASSSPGMAFMLATIAGFGDPAAGIEPTAAADLGGEAAGAAMQTPTEFGDWLDFWAALRDNDLALTDGWTEAYYTLFSQYGGDRPLVVSYATSPAAEVIFAEEELSESPTANLQCRGCAYRQVEGIGILAGTDEPEAARAFVDFMLSREVQEAIPLAMFVEPVVDDAEVPAAFERFARLRAGMVAAPIPAATVRVNQQRWLAQWTAVVRQARDPSSVR